CSTSEEYQDISSSLVKEAFENILSAKVKLSDKPINEELYLMSISEDSAQLFTMNIENEDTFPTVYWIMTNCEITEKNFKNFANYAIGDKIQLTGTVAPEGFATQSQLSRETMNFKVIEKIMNDKNLKDVSGDSVIGGITFNLSTCDIESPDQ
ncbi:MAG: hypothetical protein MK345_04890, partial [SAR202 cluster bacterium]|nr:hypothetical protein [SAR202 cluster bacterium]